jgi:alpha-beta hydrolase superfamily lysophospholipase
MEHVVFDGHAGAVHRPAVSARLAVVLCPPVGRDARSAYRPLWMFAQALASKGIAVLRYDHMGTGDSLGLPPDDDQWVRWLSGVHQAAGFARAHLGAPRLVLGGLRLGASLAAAAAAADAVRPDGLMLLAPVTSGKAWLRELQFAAALLRGRPEPSAPGARAIEADGVRLVPATVASLQGFDLRRIGWTPEALFVAAPEGAAPLPPALAAKGTRVPFPGYEALFHEAHVNSPPHELFEQAAGWLQSLASKGPSATPRATPSPTLTTDDWIEQAVTFGPGLRGVLCRPARTLASRAVVFGNTGGDPRAGIGDFATLASRELAARGVTALRFDFAGLGESAAAAAWRSHVYETPRAGDFRAAATLLEQRGCREVVLAGVCSGGHHALQAAMADPRYAGVFGINIARFVWRPGEPLAGAASEAAPRYVRLGALRQPDTWKRLLRGDVDVGEVLAGQARGLSQACDLRRKTPQTRALRAGLERLSARGARVRMIVGHQDPARHELETHFGWNGRWLARLRGVSVAIVPGLDHGLFFSGSRSLALRELLAFALASSGEALPRSHDRGVQPQQLMTHDGQNPAQPERRPEAALSPRP